MLSRLFAVLVTLCAVCPAWADIYAFNKAMGAYGGASPEGSGILPRHSWNAAYYGGNPTPADIVIARQLDNNQANRLKDLLAR